jgi:glycine cleavage system H protein
MLEDKKHSLKLTPRRLSRREFLRGAGLAVGGATLALTSACSNKNASYTAPVESPPTLSLAANASVVASDRKYSIEHMWVKSLSGGRAVIGITDKLRRLLGALDHLDMDGVGSRLETGQSFGMIGGVKMNLEMISPVSGTVVQTNEELMVNTMPINLNPYNEWLEVIELSKPAELDELLTPEEYAELQSKTLGQYDD